MANLSTVAQSACTPWSSGSSGSAEAAGTSKASRPRSWITPLSRPPAGRLRARPASTSCITQPSSADMNRRAGGPWRICRAKWPDAEGGLDLEAGFPL